VIQEQHAALRQGDRCLVLSGEPPADGDEQSFAGAVRVVPGIGYDQCGAAPRDARGIAEAVRTAMVAEWGRPADVLHVHNPLLNKNAALTPALRILRDQGIPLLLQVHDLPEDGRPRSYARTGQYVEDCHYCVINSRDRDALRASGLLPEGLHLVFNPVRPLGIPSAGPPPADLPERRQGGAPLRLLYAVRGIRRKNIGEALLLGMLLEAEITLTLPPRDPDDLARWEAWKSFACSSRLRAAFGAGLDRPLVDLVRESQCAVSTSLNEGFGFSFLEPWTAGLGVIGRRISHVAADFEAAGIGLPHLYPSLGVPVASFDAAAFAGRWKASVAAAFAAYGRSIRGSCIERAHCTLAGSWLIDFGSLDEPAQREVIARACADSALEQEILSANPAISAIRAALPRPDPQLVERNRAIIFSRYGRESCARRLREIYRAVVREPVRHRIDREALLDWFLSTEHFRMLEQW